MTAGLVGQLFARAILEVAGAWTIPSSVWIAQLRARTPGRSDRDAANLATPTPATTAATTQITTAGRSYQHDRDSSPYDLSVTRSDIRSVARQ